MKKEITHEEVYKMREAKSLKTRDKKEKITDESVVRLRNVQRTPKPIKPIGSQKKHCVGDYSCCGHII